MAWSGLIRPPQLQHSDTDAGTQRTATWLELFYVGWVLKDGGDGVP